VKVTGVEAYPVWSEGRNFFFVAVDTDEGISGVGEAGMSGREMAISGMVEHLESLLVGEDPFRTEHLWQLMYRGGFFPARHVAAVAAAAVDIALWDIKGKALNVPVYELLGGRVRDRVVCYPHNTGSTTEALIESCLQTKEEGWKFVRWHVPDRDGVLEPRRAVRDAVEQLSAVREAVGDEVELLLDAHTRLDLPEAVELCREIEPLRPFFVEDPLRSEDPAAYRMLRPRTTVPLAAGEQYGSKWEFRDLIEGELMDYARIDLCIAGGLTEAKKIAAMCEAHHIRLAAHNPLGPVSSAACLHLNLTVPNFGVQEQPKRPGAILTDIVPVQTEWEDGYLLPPDRPGLGVELDREAARKSPARMTERPALRREDGSFTNW
jgi:L-alanine-DL-glutamate epimerase-like enolase superfamily enzyme